MKSVHIHQRQWIITSRAVLPAKDGVRGFKSLALGPSVYLHYEPTLAVSPVPAQSGGGVLLGRVVGTIDSQKELHHLSGRFVLIAFPWLSLDATALLGVYYYSGGLQDVICSSSIALIAEFTGQAIEDWPLSWSHHMNWDPLPRARIVNLRKLYCDQTLNLEARSVAQRPRKLDAEVTEEEAGRRLADHYRRFMVQIATYNSRILLPLTAGRDSRTLMSALVAAGTKFEAFTWVFNAGSMRDATIAKRLCRKYGVTHHSISARGANVEALAAYRIHTAGCVVDADSQHLVPGNYYRLFGRRDLILWGGVFEMGRRFYAGTFHIQGGAHERVNLTVERIAESLGEGASMRVMASLREWHRYRTSNPIAGMDLCDSFYLDQRIGGWLSSCSQGEDSFEPEMVHPTNSWTCINLLMAASAEHRAAGTVQNAAMETLLPGVTSALQFNPVHTNMRSKCATDSIRL
jgi:hypothetical protein